MRILGGSATPVNLQHRRQGLRCLDSREKGSIMRHTSPRQEVAMRMADDPGSLPVCGGLVRACRPVHPRAGLRWGLLHTPALRVDMMNYFTSTRRGAVCM